MNVYHDDLINWKHFPRYWPIVRGNHWSPVNSPQKRPVTRSFDVLFDLRLNKRVSKQSCGWWFEKLPRLLWCHCNVLLVEQKYAHICSEWCIVGYEIDALWDLGIWPIVLENPQHLFACHKLSPCHNSRGYWNHVMEYNWMGVMCTALFDSLLSQKYHTVATIQDCEAVYSFLLFGVA